jgi:hypothetical protein
MVLVRLREYSIGRSKTWSIAKPEVRKCLRSISRNIIFRADASLFTLIPKNQRLNKYLILSGPYKGQTRTVRGKQDIRPYTMAQLDLLHKSREAVYLINGDTPLPAIPESSSSSSTSSSSTTTETTNSA